MKIKKLSVILISLLLICLTACGSDPGSTESFDDSSVPVSSEPEKYMNNLTGCYEFDDKSKCDIRPVAVMINNIRSAQKVQTGLSGASIVYESMAEGGITRLLAIFKDISSAGEIGTIRSARYSYVDFANGHDALYFHCGADPEYTVPYMRKLKLDDIDINQGIYEDYGYRVKNGLQYEHTMYTSGELIEKAMLDNDRRTVKSADYASLYEPWQNFADEDEEVTLPDGTANTVSVFFSRDYVTTFTYDSVSQRYVKTNKSGNNTDYRTGESLSYKNILIAFDNVNFFPGNYRVYSNLESGTGFYITNGTVKNIKWSKGGTHDPIKITDLDGNPVKYSAGNSYVCIPPKAESAKTVIG